LEKRKLTYHLTAILTEDLIFFEIDLQAAVGGKFFLKFWKKMGDEAKKVEKH